MAISLKGISKQPALNKSTRGKIYQETFCSNESEMHMRRWSGQTAIVTGASAGIGEAIAEALVKSGMQVVGLARRVERVQANASKLTRYKGKLHAVKCDIRNEEDVLNAFEWVTENVGIVHVLINNAGILQPTNLIDGDADMWRAILETNVFGLCLAQREAVRLMMANDIAGHIININSMTGQSHMHFPEMNVYGASKHAVTNLCYCLRQELNALQSNIKVTSISPGFVKTEIFPDEWKDGFEKVPMLDSQDVVGAIMYALGTPPDVVVNEITLRTLQSAL